MGEVRRLTRAEYEDQLRGATRIAVGIWLDRHGGVHFSVPELLEMVDLPLTEENIAICRETVRGVLRAAGVAGDPEAVIVEQELDGTVPRETF